MGNSSDATRVAKYRDICLSIDIYVPVEVCGCIAISQSQILLFGGCDNDVQDKSDTYIFDSKTST